MRRFLRFGKRRQPQLPLPEGVRIYAVGDIHGRADLLEDILTRIDDHLAAHPVARPVEVYIGDYIDRGPESFQVIDRLVQRAESHETINIKGNHETFLFEFLKRPSVLRDWSVIGGLETLRSYGLKPPLNPDEVAQHQLSVLLRAAFPKAHRMFLGNLQTFFTCGKYFFAHAGVRPGVPLAKQREEDLLWIRDDFLLYEGDFEKIIVHGHTPVRDIDIRHNRINIDTGAFATGRLSCLVFEAAKVELLPV